MNSLIAKEKREYCKKKFQEFDNDIKATWNLANELSGKTPSKSVDETIKRNFTGSTKIIADKFVQVMIEEVDKVIHTCSQKVFDQKYENIEKSMVLLEITQEVGKIIKHRLKFDVWPSFDKISPKDILENLDTLQTIITDLLNMSIKQALVPIEIKTRFLRPVYKKGRHKEMSNYRLIALQQKIFKIMKIYISDEMDNFFQKN